MTSAKKSEVTRGAKSVIAEDQASFIDDESRRGKHFTRGRKVVHLDHVGAKTPDSDAEAAPRVRRRAR